MIKTIPLKGIKSVRAFNVFYTLALGMNMMPKNLGLSFEQFTQVIHKMEPHEQERLVREALLLVELEPKDVEAIVAFALDPNGVPYSAANLKSMGPMEIINIMLAVVVNEILTIKIDLVTEEEKKNSEISQ